SGSSSPAASRVASMPALRRSSWSSSPSATSPATATCTIRAIAARWYWARAGFDELRRPALRERDVDDVEVPRDDRLREDGARRPRELRAEEARRQMRERKLLHLRELGHLGRLRGSRVHRLARALLLVLGERRLVHEQISLVRRLHDVRRRRGVAGEH